MRVTSRYASRFALCGSAYVWTNLLSVEAWSSTVKVRSLRLKWYTVDGGIIECCGTCKCVVERCITFGLAGLAYKNTGGY